MKKLMIALVLLTTGIYIQATGKNYKPVSQRFWAKHKGAVIASLGIGTLGAIIAGYKFFATQAQQTKMLEQIDQGVVKITNAFINGAELERITCDVQMLSRLTLANQKALQEQITKFNAFMSQVENGTNRSSTKAQADALVKIRSQVTQVIQKCIKQIKDEPVHTVGRFSSIADKFGAFCAAVKYYTWDKWVTKKRVKIS